MEISRDNDQIGKHRVTMTKKEAYISNKLQHQSRSLTILLKNESLLSATSVLSQRPNLLTCNTTASLDIITCTDCVNCGKFRDRFGQSSWSKSDSNYLDVKLKVFKEDDNKEFRLVQNLTMGEADFNEFM